MKKFMSLVLACLMALSLCATAFAADATNSITDLSEGAELELTSITKGATIEVVVPTKVSIGLNPYKMKVKLGDDGKFADNTSAGAQVISPYYQIVNKSTLPVDVQITVSGSVEGDGMEFYELPSGTTTFTDFGTNTKKAVYLQMKYVVEKAKETAITSLTNPTEIVIGKTAKTVGTGTASDNLIKMDAASGTTAKNALQFCFDGKLNEKSATAWTDADTLTAAIAFTFSVHTAD